MGIWRYSFLIITACTLLCGCTISNSRMKEYRETRPYLGAYVTIDCLYPPETESQAKKAIQECWSRMDQIQEELNVYSETGDVAQINKSGVSGVRVNRDVYELIKDSLEYSKLTEGAFDITVFPLIELWRNAAKSGRLPDKKQLAAAKDKVGYQNLQLKDLDEVWLLKPGMKIDLGGIASGFSCDELADLLTANGINNFLIDTGGEVFCKGRNKYAAPWSIGIQDPEDKERVLLTLRVTDKCVSTSGNYEKFYTIEKERFSHIIDPISGYPQKEVISATVIADTGLEADALSTAICALGLEKAVTLIRNLKRVEALVIAKRDGRRIKYQTPGFYLK